MAVAQVSFSFFYNFSSNSFSSFLINANLNSPLFFFPFRPLIKLRTVRVNSETRGGFRFGFRFGSRTENRTEPLDRSEIVSSDRRKTHFSSLDSSYRDESNGGRFDILGAIDN